MRMFFSGYNRIPKHLNTLRVDTKIFVSAKKYLRKKKFRISVDMALENGETKNLCFVEITVEILPAFLVKEHSNAPNSGSVNEGVAYLLLV